MAGKVIVVGSANQDYVISVDALPRQGETRLGNGLQRFPGGKGANQAVAAARLGSTVSFVGAVGDDDDGALLIREMRAEGVDTSEVEITSAARTGFASVALLPGGESALTVVPGANYALSPARAARVVGRISSPDSVLVVQCEIKPKVVAAVVQAVGDGSTRCVLHLSPYIKIDDAVLKRADPLIVNGIEASALTGFAVETRKDAHLAATALLRLATSVVIVVGREGAMWADATGSGFIVLPLVGEIVDTTGAADAFVGGVATLLSEGAGLEAAVRVGAEVGSAAMAKVGAQASYPYRRDIRQLAS